MRVIDRLYQFLEHKGLTPYAFEKACELSNGYMHKQLKGGGSIGSDVLEKIHQNYPDLSLIWLITGKGKMLFDDEGESMQEDAAGYKKEYEMAIQQLHDKIKMLEMNIADKEKIISLMEGKRKV